MFESSSRLRGRLLQVLRLVGLEATAPVVFSNADLERLHLPLGLKIEGAVIVNHAVMLAMVQRRHEPDKPSVFLVMIPVQDHTGYYYRPYGVHRTSFLAAVQRLAEYLLCRRFQELDKDAGLWEDK
jgi:hypothetical protein